MKMRSQIIWDLLQKSENIYRYEDIIVPDNFNETDHDYEGISPEEVIAEQMSDQERRKVEGKVVVHTPRFKPGVDRGRIFEWQKIEIQTSQIDEWKDDEIYYCNEGDSELMNMAAMIAKPPYTKAFNELKYQNMADFVADKNPLKRYGVEQFDAIKCLYFFRDTGIRMIKVSVPTTKYYKQFKSIKQFFSDIQNKTITMSRSLVQWNTARKIKPLLGKLNFLYNLDLVPEKQKQFRQLCKYVKDHFRDLDGLSGRYDAFSPEHYKDLVAHIDKVQEFQIFVAQSNNTVEIAKVAKELWNTEEITDGNAIDLSLWNSFLELLDWAEPVHKMLNAVHLLSGLEFDEEYDAIIDREHCDVPNDLKQEVMAYLEWKGVS